MSNSIPVRVSQNRIDIQSWKNARVAVRVSNLWLGESYRWLRGCEEGDCILVIASLGAHVIITFMKNNIKFQNFSVILVTIIFLFGAFVIYRSNANFLDHRSTPDITHTCYYKSYGEPGFYISKTNCSELYGSDAIIVLSILTLCIGYLIVLKKQQKK